MITTRYFTRIAEMDGGSERLYEYSYELFPTLYTTLQTGKSNKPPEFWLVDQW